MKYITFAIAATLAAPSVRLGGQQPSPSFAEPIGIQRLPLRAAVDTPKRDTVVRRHKPSRIPYVLVGALVAGIAAGGGLAYYWAHSSGECLCNPFPAIGVVVGGGMVVGGLIGLIVYFGVHP